MSTDKIAGKATHEQQVIFGDNASYSNELEHLDSH